MFTIENRLLFCFERYRYTIHAILPLTPLPSFQVSKLRKVAMDSHRPSFSVSKPPIFIHSFPGAWPSEPTLSEETPVECPAPEDAVPPLHLAETTNTEGFMRRVVVNPAGRRSTRVSVATYDDNESVLSDDFYSFISQYASEFHSVNTVLLPFSSVGRGCRCHNPAGAK